VATRKFQLKTWQQEGGVMIISYEMYRNLTGKQNGKGVIFESLVSPGPDVVVCDEGHLLKNTKSALSRALSEIQTSRRIVLTGTPMQNNLKEYHCMVQFIKPNILGNYQEFDNRSVHIFSCICVWREFSPRTQKRNLKFKRTEV